jgi:hypothetical protein
MFQHQEKFAVKRSNQPKVKEASRSANPLKSKIQNQKSKIPKLPP